MNIYQKLQKARELISEMDIKKDGYNDYSKYHYFTPEKINTVVTMACMNAGIMTKFDLIRNELGIEGKLNIFDPEFPEEIIEFTLCTDVPTIKATNITQQYGGAGTYAERYLSMIAFSIKDNSEEFDSKDHSITDGQLQLIENLIRNSSIDENLKTTIESEVYSYDIERAEKCIIYLKENQIESANPSQTEIKEKLIDINLNPKK